MEAALAADAAAIVAERLEGSSVNWVVGGSTGLVLRGARLDRSPRDLDIYADKEDATAIHGLLKEYAADNPEFSETDRYRSVLSHYLIIGTMVELVGDFSIRDGDSRYHTEVRRLLYPGGQSVVWNGKKIRLVPLGHELIFNVMRKRSDRCEEIARLICQDKSRHMPVLIQLLEQNEFTEETRVSVMRFLEASERG